MSEPITVSLITVAGVIVTAFLSFLAAYLNMRKKQTEDKLQQAEDEIDFQANAITFSNYIERIAPITDAIQELMDSTNIDRYIAFRAWNGRLEPRWTTAILMMHTHNRPMKYIHWELDDHYRHMLQDLSRHGALYYVTEEMADSKLRQAYDAEGVTASYLTHIAHMPMPGDDEKKAVFYCSFATHSGEIDLRTRLQCLSIANQLKGIVSS